MIDALMALQKALVLSVIYVWPFCIWAIVGLILSPLVIERQWKAAYSESMAKRMPIVRFYVTDSLMYMTALFSDFIAREKVGAASKIEVRNKITTWQFIYVLSVLIPFACFALILLFVFLFMIAEKLGLIDRGW